MFVFSVGPPPASGLLNPVNLLSPVTAQTVSPSVAKPQPNYNVSSCDFIFVYFLKSSLARFGAEGCLHFLESEPRIKHSYRLRLPFLEAPAFQVLLIFFNVTSFLMHLISAYLTKHICSVQLLISLFYTDS